MALSTREISDLALEVLAEEHKKEPYASHVDINNFYTSEILNESQDKIELAIELLEFEGNIEAKRTSDGKFYAIGITTKGKLHLDNIQRETSLANSKLEKSQNKDEFPKFYNILLDGNETEAGKKLRAKLESAGFSEEQIEDMVQIEHALSFSTENRIVFKPYFDFNFNRIKSFAEELRNKGFLISDIIDYLELLKKENFQRRAKFVTEKEIDELNIPAERIINEVDIDIFNENITLEIEFLNKSLKTTNVKQNTPVERKLISEINTMKNDREFYNDFLFDIIKISKHFESISDPFLQKNYLDWLLKLSEERYTEQMMGKSEAEMSTRAYKDGLFMYNSIKRFIEDKNKSFEKMSGMKENDMETTSTTKAKNRIVWLGSIADIKELFQELKSNGLIQEIASPNAVIRDCFVKPDGSDFDEDTVRKTNIKGKSRNYNKVKDVVKILNDKKGK